MSNLVIVGIIGIVTVICCVVIAKLTGNERKTLMGGIFALLSAGGFGYAIAYLIRKGLEGPYLTVAVLIGIIVPILIFLTIYNISKEVTPKGSRAERTLDDKIRNVEEDRQTLKKAAKEIDILRKQMDLEKEIFHKDKGNLEVLRKNLEKERNQVEEQKALLAEGKLKLAASDMAAVAASEQTEFAKEKESLIEGFERDKEQMEQSFEEECQKLRLSMEEEKRKLQQVFAQEKKKLEDASPALAAEEAVKAHLERIKELEAQEAAFGEERDGMNQMLRDLNLQQRKMKEEKDELKEQYEEKLSLQQQRQEELEKEIEHAFASLADEKENMQTMLEEERENVLSEIEAQKAESQAVLEEERESARARLEGERENARITLEEERERYQSSLEFEKANTQTALARVRELEQQIREREQEEERRRQEAKAIHANTAKNYEYENVLEKGRTLQKRGLYQLAITLYEECGAKMKDENQKQMILKEMASCYMDAGETSKAKKLLAKR